MPLIQYCESDKIEKNKMGCDCSVFEVQERLIHGFGGENCGKEAIWKTQT
jgi:hypothetical protein